MTRRLALVTGASAGIGAAFARLCAQRGYDLALTARRDDRLQALAAEIRARWGVEVVVVLADLAAPDAPGAILAALDRPVDMLVNNAGYGLPGAYADTAWADQAIFLQVMVTAVCALTHKTLPGMLDRGFGRVVNVASLAGLAPGGAGATLYAASKAFLVKFSQSLHLETRGTGVHVSALCPGFTYSEFHDVTGSRDLVSRMPKWVWQDADTVVRAGWAAVEANRAVCVPGAVNKTLAVAAKLVPDGLALRIVGSQGKRLRHT